MVHVLSSDLLNKALKPSNQWAGQQYCRMYLCLLTQYSSRTPSSPSSPISVPLSGKTESQGCSQRAHLSIRPTSPNQKKMSPCRIFSCKLLACRNHCLTYLSPFSQSQICKCVPHNKGSKGWATPLRSSYRQILCPGQKLCIGTGRCKEHKEINCFCLQVLKHEILGGSVYCTFLQCHLTFLNKLNIRSKKQTHNNFKIHFHKLTFLWRFQKISSSAPNH